MRSGQQISLSRREVRSAERAAETSAKRVRSRSRIAGVAIVSTLALGTAAGGVAYALSGDAATMNLSPGGSATSTAVSGLTTSYSGATFDLPGRPTGGSLYLGLEPRRAADGSLYRTKARVFPDGSVTVDIGKVTARGAEQYLGTKKIGVVVGTGPTSLQVQGAVTGDTASSIGVRAWTTGSTQPAAQLIVDDATGVKGGTSARTWAYLSSQATEPISFTVAPLAASTPAVTPTTPPVTGPPVATVVPTKPVATKPAQPPAPTTTVAPPPPPPADTTSASMKSVLATSGAAVPAKYAVPAGATVVPAGGNIASAVANTAAGGTVVLRGGVYRQAVGSVNKKITLQAYPGEQPVLSGADVISGWAASGGAWRSTSWTSPFPANQYRPDEVPAGTAAGQVEQAYRNGSALKQVMSRNQVTAGTFWIDPSNKQLWVGDNPSGATVEVSNRERGLTLEPSAAGSKILGLRFTAYAGPHLDNGSQLYVGSPNTLIQNSVFDHSSSAGLKLAATNVTVDHITAEYNAAEGMTGNRNDNSVVKDSQFLHNNRDNFKSEGCAMSCTVAGFKTAHTANMSVTGNAFVDNVANGFWCDLGCTNTTITGNAVSGSYDGIFYEVSSGAKIANNYVEESDKGIRISGSDNVTISNNSLYDNKWQFTIYDDGRAASTDSYSAGRGLSWNTGNVVIENTKIVGGSKTQKLLETNARQVTTGQMLSRLSGNTNTGNQVMMWCTSSAACTTYQTIAAWKAASGKGF